MLNKSVRLFTGIIGGIAGLTNGLDFMSPFHLLVALIILVMGVVFKKRLSGNSMYHKDLDLVLS